MSAQSYRDYPEVAEMVARSLPRTMTSSAAYRAKMRCIHKAGPRPIGELIAELAAMINAPAKVNARIDAYASMNPQALELCGANDWAASPELVTTKGVRK